MKKHWMSVKYSLSTSVSVSASCKEFLLVPIPNKRMRECCTLYTFNGLARQSLLIHLLFQLLNHDCVSCSYSFSLSKLLNWQKSETRDHVEVCPIAGVIVQEMADRIYNDGGLSLIVDYGHDGTKTDTFRVNCLFHAYYLHFWTVYDTHTLFRKNCLFITSNIFKCFMYYFLEFSVQLFVGLWQTLCIFTHFFTLHSCHQWSISFLSCKYFVWQNSESHTI